MHIASKAVSRVLAPVAIAAGVSLAWLVAEGSLEMIRVTENLARDVRIAALTPPAPVSEDIVVVTFTPESLEGLAYRSPLDRGAIREVLRALEAHGVRAIGLDVLFTQPTEPAKDRALGETLRSLDVPVVVATAGLQEGLRPAQVEYMEAFLDGVPSGPAVAYQDRSDGVVRAVLLRRGDPVAGRLSFTAVLARRHGVEIPPGTDLHIAFRGRPHPELPAFAVYPAHAVAALPPEWLRGRTVLVGGDLQFTDRHRASMSAGGSNPAALMSGVVLQAHALSQLVERRRSAHVDPYMDSLVVLCAAIAGVALASVARSLSAVAAIGGGAVAAFWVGSFALFRLGGLLVSVVTPTFAFVTAVAIVFGYRWRGEREERRFIRDAFGRYVSPAVVERLVDDPSLLAVGGERREVTFMFTDVTGYTSLSERTDPEILLRLMNEYFDGAIRIIIEHHGTIDRIVGDALAVMFNAPAPQADHAARGIRCALALDAYCHGFAARQASRGVAFGETRIGINTGDAVVGNYGGAAHVEYSATGDAINVAARLESANRRFGTRVCAGERTIRSAGGAHSRPIGRLVLEGRGEETQAFEVLAPGAVDEAALEAYLAAYRRLDTAGAREAFAALADRWPGDRLIAYHAARLSGPDADAGSRIVLDGK